MYKLKCKKCTQRGVNVLDRFAYSVDGAYRCRSCGAMFGINKAFGLLNIVIEGGILFVAILYSFIMLVAWPIVIGVTLVILSRLFFIPIFAREKNNASNSKLRKKRR